jgi:microcystin-dependent protein
MGVVNTTYTFTSTDTITSAKMNNIIDETTFTGDAIQGTTLQVVSPGKLAVNAGGITSNELADGAVVTAKIADGAVTQAKTSNMLLPAGAIMAFAMNGAPTGWLSADGSNVSRITYANLFSAIGTTYGSGDGSTTFAIPDLRGIFVRGSGSQTISGTSHTGTFAQKQGDAIRNISGSFAFGLQMAAIQSVGGAFTALESNQFMAQQSTANSQGLNQIQFNASSSGVPTASENRPANIALLYCIKI